MTHNENNNKSIKIKPELRQMLELADKYLLKLAQLCSIFQKVRDMEDIKKDSN